MPRPNSSAPGWPPNKAAIPQSPIQGPNLRSHQANNERAQADLARMKPLLDKAEISRLQYDAYQSAARVAESELRAAQERVASAQQNAGIRKAAIGSAQSRVAVAQAQV